MKQHFNQGGRPHKINPSVHRYVVRFDAAENTVFLSLFDKSGAVNKAAFIKSVLLGKPFKVFVVDENTRISLTNCPLSIPTTAHWWWITILL